MQIKYSKSIKNRVIFIELETANFTQRENLALEKFSEPIISFEKLYEGIFPVKFEKRIKTGFKVRMKFDGTKDVDAAARAANAFFEEIQELLEETMRNLMDDLVELEIDFVSSTGFIDVKY